MAQVHRIRFGLVALMVAASASPLVADVTFSGTVFPETPEAVGVDDTVVIGPRLEDLFPAVDPRGEIVVDGGFQFETGRLLNGESHDALASLRVTGDGTRLQLNSPGDELNPTLGVGRLGSGYLRIDDGAWVEVGSRPGGMGVMAIGSLGFDDANVAAVEVRRSSTLLTVGQQLVVGFGVSTRLSISDGAVVRSGRGVEVSGLLEVSGPRSELQTQRLTLGTPLGGVQTGRDGEICVKDGAVVRPVTPFFGRAEVGLGGRVVLERGTFALPIDQMLGVLEGSGTFTEGIQVGGEGTVRAGLGDTLVFLGNLRSSGSVYATDATLRVYGAFENSSEGGSGGLVRFEQSEVLLERGMTNNGSVEITANSLLIAEEFTNRGGEIAVIGSNVELATDYATNEGSFELIDSELLLTGSGSFRNHGPQSGLGGARIVLNSSRIDSARNGAPGIINYGVIEARSGTNVVRSSVDSIDGSLEVSPNATIIFESEADFYGGVAIAQGGVASFAEYSTIEDVSIALSNTNLVSPNLYAVGQSSDDPQDPLVVGGSLNVAIESLDGLESEQVYKLVEADQIFGQFSEYDLPDLPGTLEFLPQLSDTSLSLRVIDTTLTLPGDFSGDGRVDAADYTLWRDGLPGGSRWLDHAMWRANYGRTLSAPRSVSVPEPASAGLVLVGWLAGRRSHRG